MEGAIEIHLKRFEGCLSAGDSCYCQKMHVSILINSIFVLLSDSHVHLKRESQQNLFVPEKGRKRKSKNRPNMHFFLKAILKHHYMHTQNYQNNQPITQIYDPQQPSCNSQYSMFISSCRRWSMFCVLPSFPDIPV